MKDFLITTQKHRPLATYLIILLVLNVQKFKVKRVKRSSIRPRESTINANDQSGRKRKTSQEAHENSVRLNNKKMLDIQEKPVGKVPKSKTNALMFDPTLKVSQSHIWTKVTQLCTNHRC